MAKRPKSIADIDKKIRQWQTKFSRAMNAISKLSAQKKRMEKAERMAKLAEKYLPSGALRPEHYPVGGMSIAIAAPLSEAVIEPGKSVTYPVAAVTVNDGLDMPDFLRRTSTKLDKVEAEVIKAEVEAKRLAKSRGRIAKLKAKKAGDTKKMPLSGKAALDHIRNG